MRIRLRGESAPAKSFITQEEWISLAPTGTEMVPLNIDGSMVWFVEAGVMGYASLTASGRKKMRRLYVQMATRARQYQRRK